MDKKIPSSVECNFKHLPDFLQNLPDCRVQNVDSSVMVGR